MEQIEHIHWKKQPLCYILRAEFSPDQPNFPTPPDFKLQVGYIVYPKGHEIPRHVHRQIERRIVGTSEVLIVRKGHCEVDVYNDDRQIVATRELFVGDVMIMVAGGHSFRMIEDTVLLEVKQGPYPGVDEKERF
jgi:quercetin dioxygenase-like cupin family protein